MQIFRTHITKDNSDGFPPRFPIEPRKNELVEFPITIQFQEFL